MTQRRDESVVRLLEKTPPPQPLDSPQAGCQSTVALSPKGQVFVLGADGLRCVCCAAYSEVEAPFRETHSIVWCSFGAFWLWMIRSVGSLPDWKRGSQMQRLTESDFVAGTPNVEQYTHLKLNE